MRSGVVSRLLVALLGVAALVCPARADAGASLRLLGTDAYVTFGAAPALALPVFTLETLFASDGAGEAVSSGDNGVDAVPLLTKGRHQSNSEGTANDMNWFLGIRASDGVLVADFEEGAAGPNPGRNHPIAGVTPVVDGAWHHAAATFDGSTWRLYLDGSLEAELFVGVPVRSDSVQQAALGSALDSGGRPEGHFAGVLDEARVWSVVRSAAEIAAGVDARIASAPGLVARWALDDASGRTVADSAGRHVDGTIVGDGFAWEADAPFAVNRAPGVPRAPSPATGTADVSTSPTLAATVSDLDGDPLTVTVWARETPVVGPDFTLVALPDTQFYVSGLEGGSPDLFEAQTQWIVDHASELNAAFVTHLGDCVQNGNNGGDDTEWRYASHAMGLLEDPEQTILPAGIPFGVTVGNHDETPQEDPIGNPPGTSTASYNRFFGVGRFAGRPYYGGHFGDRNDNHYELFRAGGMDFIVVHLAYDPTPDPDVLAWADALLTSYADRRAIVVTHSLIGAGEPGSFSSQGQVFYDALKRHPNLFLMLCGHVCGEGRREDVFDGHVVDTVLADYQCRHNGGDGWMRLLRFSPAKNQIHVQTYSPRFDKYEVDDSSDFTLDYPMGGRPFEPLATTVVARGDAVSVPWPALLSGTSYEWYVTASDGARTTTGPVWTFRTATRGAACASDADCGDGNPCTADTCVAGTCVHGPTEGVPCDDGNACTRTDVCRAGVCVGDDPVLCTGGDACHASTCDARTGGCTAVTRPDGTPCEDGDVCTTGEACVAGACVAGVPLACPTGTVEADTTVYVADPTGDRHASPILQIDGGSQTKYAFLRVRVDGLTASLADARLRLRVDRQSVAASNKGGRIHPSACDWDETTLSWSTLPDPPFESTVIDAVDHPVAPGDAVEFDVTQAIRDGVRCFAIDTTSANEVQYRSLDAPDGRPELRVASGCACAPDGPPPPSTSTTLVTVTTTSTSTSSTTTATGPPGTTGTSTTDTSTSTTTSSSVTTTTADGGPESSTTTTSIPTTTTSLPPPVGTPRATLDADAYVDARTPRRSHAREPVLRLRARPRSVVYLRFRIDGAGGEGAVLRLAGAPGGAVPRLHVARECGWDPTRLTWRSQPGFDEAVVGVGRVARDGTVAIDVPPAALPAAGTVCFALDGGRAAYASSRGAAPPALLFPAR